ncbi:hypothetical protein BGZ58_010111 [Dissophora ornata]|nr:hypothetical protein BGZ58_010111 [Dissophora ornata]
MEESQSLRLIGKVDIEKITLEHVDGQNVVYWEDIEQVFPGVKNVKNGGVSMSMMRDSNGFRIVPHRIKHCPGVVLDVVLSTTVEHVHINPPIQNPSPALDNVPTNDLFQVSSPSSSTANGSKTSSIVTPAESVSALAIAAEPSTDLDQVETFHFGILRKSTIQIQEDMKVATDALIARNRAGESLDAHSIVEEILPVEYRESEASLWTVTRELKVLHEQGHTTQKFVQQVLKEAKQIQDRLVLIERKTAAILTQSYELLEYTIPRLFIVLPETSTTWNPKTMFRTKFRLHFICECGEHTMPAVGNTMPHHLHLANHEGYVVNKPTEFFKKYGPFLMVMLEIIKLGTGIAGHVVPALASLKVVDIVDSAQSTIDSVTSKVIQGVDYSLAYLDENRTLIQKSKGVIVEGNAMASQQDLASYLASVDGVEGVDLRQLGSYLTANSSDNLLGNLYRMTTKDGYVKWVCRDHYGASLQEEYTQKLRDVVKLARGEFDEQLGKVKIELRSSFAAAEFYDTVRKATSVLELDVSLSWDQEYTDFVKLKNIISRSTIRSIMIRLHFKTGPTTDTKINGSLRYDPIFEIMRLSKIQSFGVSDVPKEFFLQSTPLLRKADLSNLRHLRIDGQDFNRTYDLSDADITKLKLLVARAPNLSTFSLGIPLGRLLPVLSDFTSHQIYTIIVNNLSLRLLPPRRGSHTPKGTLKDLTHLFQVHGAQLEAVNFSNLSVDDSAMKAMVEATRNSSNLKEITLERGDEYLGDKRIKDLASIVAQSKLRYLRIALQTESARVRILKSIQWEHIRELKIVLEHEDREMGTMKALVDGIEKISERCKQGYLKYSVSYTEPKPSITKTQITLKLSIIRYERSDAYQATPLAKPGTHMFSQVEMLEGAPDVHILGSAFSHIRDIPNVTSLPKIADQEAASSSESESRERSIRWMKNEYMWKREAGMLQHLKSDMHVVELFTLYNLPSPAEYRFVSILGPFTRTLESYIQERKGIRTTDRAPTLEEQSLALKGPLTLIEIKSMTDSIASALKWCHDNHVVHLSLTTASIFLQGVYSEQQWKLWDFSHARFIGEAVDLSTEMTGYTAPEILIASRRSKQKTTAEHHDPNKDTTVTTAVSANGVVTKTTTTKSSTAGTTMITNHDSEKLMAITPMDMWSLGQIAYEMQTAQPMFTSGEDALIKLTSGLESGEDAANAKARDKIRQQLQDHMKKVEMIPDAGAREMITGLLELTPERRLEHWEVRELYLDIQY